MWNIFKRVCHNTRTLNKKHPSMPIAVVKSETHPLMHTIVLKSKAHRCGKITTHRFGEIHG